MTPKRKVWIHRSSAFVWIAIGVVSFIFGFQDSVVLVWIASVYANVKSDWGAGEAADTRDLIKRLNRLQVIVEEIQDDDTH